MTEESQNEEGHIDLNKYEGHSKGPWYFFKGNNGDNDWWILDANNEVILKCGSEPLPADYLIADAPLLLEEVKRLRERLIRAYDWAENAVNGNDSAMMDYTEYVCGGDEE